VKNWLAGGSLPTLSYQVCVCDWPLVHCDHGR